MKNQPNLLTDETKKLYSQLTQNLVPASKGMSNSVSAKIEEIHDSISELYLMTLNGDLYAKPTQRS